MTVAEAQSSVKSGTIKYHTENMTCNDESEVITLHFIYSMENNALTSFHCRPSIVRLLSSVYTFIRCKTSLQMLDTNLKKLHQ